MRTLGLRRVALREEAELDSDLRRLLDAYCAGLNEAARIASAPPAEFQLLRLDFEPWRPADMLAGGKLLSFGLSTNWERELLRADLVRELGEERAAKIDPTYPKGNPVALHPGQGFDGDGLRLAEQIGRVREQIGLAAAASGSNNWAVTPARSATGGALLAGDPHLPSGMPGVWYELGLELGGRFCRGASIPGLPGISLGQNNDVAFAFTNVMADVEDLFVERIEDESYEFEGEQRPLEIIEELISVRGQDQAERQEIRLTHHGPIVNQALGADDQQPLALRWAGIDEPAISQAFLAVLEPRSGPELVELLRERDHAGLEPGLGGPARIDRLQDGRPDPDAEGRLPGPAEARLDGRVRVGGLDSLRRAARAGRSRRGLPRHGQQPGRRRLTIPTTSPATGWTATARRGSSSCSSSAKSTTSTTSAACRPTSTRSPATRSSIGSPACSRTTQREVRAIERLKSWDRTLRPRTVAGTIYQAFMLRLAREFTRAAIGDRDLAERYLDRADNGFIAHVTSPWRWQSHLLDLWEEADEELIGGSWDELALEALRGALDDLEERFGPDPEGWRWGSVHALELPARSRRRPTRSRSGSSTARSTRAARRRPSRRSPTTRSIPTTRSGRPSWRMVADPSAPERSQWQAFTGQSGHAWSTHYDDLQPRWEAGTMQPMAGEGPFETLVLSPADAVLQPLTVLRRDQIKLTDEEQRELIESERIVVVSSLGPRGWPHLMPLWYVPRDGEIWIWTYAKSQKVKNLERDPRATLLIETGHRVRRAARRPDRGRGRADPGPRPGRRVRQGDDDPLQRGDRVGRGRCRRRRSRRRRRSGSRSTSIRSGSRAGTTASWAGSH